jgi:hypothetical protein
LFDLNQTHLVNVMQTASDKGMLTPGALPINSKWLQNLESQD